MMIFTKEQEKYVLEQKKFGIASTPIVKSKSSVEPLVIVWTHHCTASRKARKYSGAHKVLSSTTKMLVEKTWIDVDDQTDMVGTYDNFGARQQIGEFSYNEVYISPDLLLRIVSYGETAYTLDNAVVLTRHDLTEEGADALYAKIQAKKKAEHEQSLINGREIYIDTKGRKRVNIGENSYVLEMLTGETNQFNVGDDHESYSSSDPLLHAWLQAAQEVGVPPRYAWSGVMNALGHHGSVSIPWKAKPHDYMRA